MITLKEMREMLKAKGYPRLKVRLEKPKPISRKAERISSSCGTSSTPASVSCQTVNFKGRP